MRRRHVAFLGFASVAAVAAFAACTLNPQPLPPRDDFGGQSTSDDASAVRSDGGLFGTTPDVPGPEDAAAGTPNADGGDDDGGADAADAGDAADADGG